MSSPVPIKPVEKKVEPTFDLFKLQADKLKLNITGLQKKDIKLEYKSIFVFTTPDDKYSIITAYCDKKMAYWRDSGMTADESCMQLEIVINTLSYLHHATIDGQKRGHDYNDKYRQDFNIALGATLWLHFTKPITEKEFIDNFVGDGFGMLNVDGWIREQLPEEIVYNMNEVD